MAKKKHAKKSAKNAVVDHTQDALYAGILDHGSLRRDVLEVAKLLIVIRQRLEKIHLLREQRLMLQAALKRSFTELASDSSHYAKTLPEIPKASLRSVQRYTRPEERKETSLERIQRELAEIDKRLNSIGS